MLFQFLGTGNAAQVPCYGCECQACVRARQVIDFRRTPCSAKIQTSQGTLLIDAGQTNLTEQFIPGSLQGILLTHYHMDHVQGLFHLRWGKNDSIQVIGPDDPQGADDLFKHPGILDFTPAPPLFKPFSFIGLTITPVPLNHSKPCVGYYITDGICSLAYLTDTLGLPDTTLQFLRQQSLHTLIIDCSYPPKENPKNHNSLTEALAIANQLQPEQTLLTHISHDLDQYLLTTNYQLPENVILARDNQKLFRMNQTAEILGDSYG